MKAGWTTKPLEEACTFINGLWKGEKAPLKIVGVIRNTNFTKDGTLDDSDIAFIEVEAKKFEKRKLNPGDIILEKSGGGPKQPVGRVVLFEKSEGDYSFSNFTAAIRVKSASEIDPRFLYKFLHGTYLSGVTEGMQSNSTGIRNLDGDKYKAIQISYPGIEEQRRIVTLLGEAFADIATAKANAEKNLQNARKLFESQRQLLLQPKDGWHEAPLADLCNIKHGYAFEGEYFSDTGDHVLLTPGSFFETGGFRDRGEKTKYFTGPIPSDYVLNQGDLLVAMTEQAAGLLGSPLLVPESNHFLHNQRLGLVTGKPDAPWTNAFFFHVFNLEAVRKAIHASASGAKVRHTSPGKIGAVKVAFPDNQAEQLLIAAQIEEIEQASIALQSIYRQKLTALDDLKKSLLHQAFSGHL